MRPVLYSSVTRIADFQARPPHYEKLDRSHWASGDYVVGEVLPRAGRIDTVELADGRECYPIAGDLVVGAFGRRFATLELTGTFEEIGDDGSMACMTSGGCFGATTSQSQFVRAAMPARYVGHLLDNGEKVTMGQFAPSSTESPFGLPVVLLVGTSMSAGKTYSGRIAIRELKDMGHTVLGAKLTGAGRYRDILSFKDAGADRIFDFVDAGLPTSVVPPDEYRAAIGALLSRMARVDATVAVVEAGASPLEPYNGGTLVDMLGDQVKFTILAASDPYAVVGIQAAWQRPFDLVTGPTANTRAGIALVQELAGLHALDLVDHASHADLRQRLEAAVGPLGKPLLP